MKWYVLWSCIALVASTRILAGLALQAVVRGHPGCDGKTCISMDVSVGAERGLGVGWSVKAICSEALCLSFSPLACSRSHCDSPSQHATCR